MKIALYSTKSYDREFFEKANESFGYDLTFIETRLNKHTVALAKQHDAICAFVNDKVSANTLRVMREHDIDVLALRCAGFNNVDLEAAKEFNIKILRVPAYSPEAVAEHALALIFTLNRKTHKAYNRVREGNFSLERLTGFNISGKTIGVVGTGAIGKAFIKMLKGFSVRILASDPYPSEELQKEGVTYLPINELLANADITSLHCPLTPKTMHLINDETLKHIKPGAMLINTSRGKLVDTDAAIDALKSKQLGYLGIDVYAEEEKLFLKTCRKLL